MEIINWKGRKFLLFCGAGDMIYIGVDLLISTGCIEDVKAWLALECPQST